MKKQILFVCTANICRSPMAAGLYNQGLDHNREMGAWSASSAGTWGSDGHPAAPSAIAVMRDRGIDLKDHRSRIVDEKIIRDADLVITMEAAHKEALRIEFATHKSKIIQISELVGQHFDIEDPFGQSHEAYEHTAQELEELLIAGTSRLIQITQQLSSE